MVMGLKFYKISFPAEQILASQERLSSMQLLEVKLLSFNTKVN
jgi:hypothetical protein